MTEPYFFVVFCGTGGVAILDSYLVSLTCFYRLLNHFGGAK